MSTTARITTIRARPAPRPAAAHHDGLQLDAYCVGGAGLRAPEASFTDAYGVSDSGAVLVRPDGFVSWRADSPTGDSVAAVGTALRVALARA